LEFTGWIYGIFLIVAVLVYWLVPRDLKGYFLLAASVLFILYASPFYLILLFLLSSTVYFISRKAFDRRFWLITGTIIPLAVLGYYKYQGLLKEILDIIGQIPGFHLSFAPIQAALPLGISYFTFKLIHFTVDSYQGNRPEDTYWRFLLYMFFFPILPMGPIERWPNFVNQAWKLKGFRWDYLSEGLARIITGLFKKLVLADTLALYSEKLNAAGLSSTVYWIAIYAYALRIYFDFSGYSDIAIGSARFFGFRVMENFNNPYLKRNLSLFWKSWHMSLTGWFRDYVFIPLGGSRAGFNRTVINTLVVMAVTGLWHGASLHFILWGLFHGGGLIILRLYNKLIAARLPAYWHESRLSYALSTLLTFHFVTVGWVFFAEDFQQSFYVIKKLLFIL